MKMKGQDALFFQRLFWGALAGCLAAALLGQSPFLESLELGMLKWRYKVSEQLSSLKSKPDTSDDIALVTFDDSAQFDLGIARFNDLRSQSILGEALATIERGEPAVVGIDLDLRGSANGDLARLFSRYRNVVLALFGSLEGSTDLPAAEFMTHAASYGYGELTRESNGVVYKLPVNYLSKKQEEHGLAPVPTFTEAMIDVYRRVKGVGPASQFMSQLPDQPVYINFKHTQYPTVSLQDVLSPGFDPSIFKGRMVLVGSMFTSRRDDPLRFKTPLSDASPELVVHAQALSTLLDNEVIFSFAREIARHFLIFLGAIFGAFSSALPMTTRSAFFAFGTIILLGVAQICFQVFHVALPVVPPMAVIFACFVLGTVIYLDTDLRERNRELAAARESMQVRAEEERRRIAEDLHDETLPALSAVARMADRLSQDMGDNPVPRQMRERLDTAVSEMRRVINDLHPSVLETMGFVPALENLLNICSRDSGIEGTFVDGISAEHTNSLSWFAKLQLYRIVQEALNNVHKHAAAKTVHMIIKEDDSNLVISVADDGKGIDPRLIKRDSHGLINIRQRAQLIGARVEWRKPDEFNSGTELKVEIPTDRSGKESK
jgi:signal transduction histidine kinase